MTKEKGEALDPRFKFEDDIPQDQRGIIAGYLVRWQWLLPRWIQGVTIIVLDQTEDSPAAETSTHLSYRFASIRIYTSWMRDDEEYRDSIIAHELLHIPIAGLYEYAYRNLKLLAGDDKRLTDVVIAELEDRLESTVQDLTISIRDLRLPDQSRGKR